MKRTKRHLGIKIICCVLAIILCAEIVLFGRLGVTLLTVKSDEELGIYYINYREDYKLQPLLDAGGVKTQDELAKYLIRILLKGLPVKIDYDVPSLACSTFFAKTPEGGFLLGRNLDNQETDLAAFIPRSAGVFSIDFCQSLCYTFIRMIIRDYFERWYSHDHWLCQRNQKQ